MSEQDHLNDVSIKVVCLSVCLSVCLLAHIALFLFDCLTIRFCLVIYLACYVFACLLVCLAYLSLFHFFPSLSLLREFGNIYVTMCVCVCACVCYCDHVYVFLILFYTLTHFIFRVSGDLVAATLFNGAQVSPRVFLRLSRYIT